MKKLSYLVVVIAFLCCDSALADWRDDNPNQPNGYRASTFRYHHGTPGGEDGPANGYRASSFRSSHGLEGYMPPDKSTSRWGDDRAGRGQSNRWGRRSNDNGMAGSMMGRNFRRGRAEGAAMRYGSLQQRMLAQEGVGNNRYLGGNQYSNRNPGASQYRGNLGGSDFNGNAGTILRSRLNSRYNQNGINPSQFSGNANRYGSFHSNYATSQSNTNRNMGQSPMGNLLRQSRGGFNRIYR